MHIINILEIVLLVVTAVIIVLKLVQLNKRYVHTCEETQHATVQNLKIAPAKHMDNNLPLKATNSDKEVSIAQKQEQNLKKIFKNFSIEEFKKCADQAYILIVENFYSGNIEEVEDLLTEKAKNQLILNRKNCTSTDVIISKVTSHIEDINIEKDESSITINFTSNQIHIHDIKSYIDINELWTFIKDNASSNQIWKLSKLNKIQNATYASSE